MTNEMFLRAALIESLLLQIADVFNTNDNEIDGQLLQNNQSSEDRLLFILQRELSYKNECHIWLLRKITEALLADKSLYATLSNDDVDFLRKENHLNMQLELDFDE